MKILRLIALLVVLPLSLSAQWIKQTVNTTASFRGLSVVNEKIVWASGTGGTVIKTTDGGTTWKVMTAPGAEKLDFRDIEAFDANTAYILSIGNGDNSRIYKTTDGGATWKLQFTNKSEKAFYDAIACWDKNTCIAMSDPVDGHYVLISTTDGGMNWNPIVSNQMPAAKDGEAAFAASGTCLYIAPGGAVYLVSGGSDARVFRSADRGKTWNVANAPIVKGTSGSGIFSIAMSDALNGVIVGGNYEKPDERNDTFAMTTDARGAYWKLGARPNGYRSGVAFIDRNTIVAVGTNGSDISYSRSWTWEKLGTDNLNAVAAKGRDAIWAVGPNGSVFRLDPRSVRSAPSRVSLKEYEPQYHYGNVSALKLSHSIVAGNCRASEKACAESRTIDVSATGPQMEDAPHEYAYIVSDGKIIGDGPSVQWDLSKAKPGKHSITVGIRIPFLNGAYWDFGMMMTQEVVVR
jgi:photosystem II stability/assembly factor-like uncharacterized protein